MVYILALGLLTMWFAGIVGILLSYNAVCYTEKKQLFSVWVYTVWVIQARSVNIIVFSSLKVIQNYLPAF